MFIESLLNGVAIFLTLALVALKLPWRVVLIGLHHCLAVDIAIGAIAYLMHSGSTTGMLSAGIAGLVTSFGTIAGRWLIGHLDAKANRYYPGLFCIDPQKLRR